MRVIVASVAVVALAIACGKGSDAGPNEDPIEAPVRDAAGSAQDTGAASPPTDAGADGDGDAKGATCSDLAVPSGSLEVVVHTEPAPVPQGGAFPGDSTWKATALHQWGAPGASTKTMAGGVGLRLLGDKLDLVAGIAEVDQAARASFSVEGTKLTLKMICSSANGTLDGGNGETQWGYTVEAPTKLHLFAGTTGTFVEYVFEPLP